WLPTIVNHSARRCTSERDFAPDLTTAPFITHNRLSAIKRPPETIPCTKVLPDGDKLVATTDALLAVAHPRPGPGLCRLHPAPPVGNVHHHSRAAPGPARG